MKGFPWTALILTGGGWPGDYDIVRSLGHAGVPSAVASSDPSSIAFRSRFVRWTMNLPPFDEAHEAEILNLLVKAASKQGAKPVLYYVGDSELLFVAKYAKALSGFYRFLLPDPQLLDAITNKAQFRQFALEHGLPIPQTIVAVSPGDLRNQMDNIPFPCIAKPPMNREWFWDSEGRPADSYKKALRKFRTREELSAFCDRLPTWGSGVVIQRYIEGETGHTVSFLGYFDESSSCLGSFVGREVRTNPPVIGDGTFMEIIEDRKLERSSIAILQRLGMKGIVKIDYTWDRISREFKMLEIEPHYQNWHLLGSYMGINLALVAYRHQRREPLGRVVSPRARNGSLLYLRPDLSSYLRAYRKSGDWPLRRYLRSLFQSDCYRVLDSGDPWPFIASTVLLLRRALIRLFQILPIPGISPQR